MKKEDLKRLYITENMTMEKIAEKFGVTKGNIRYWLLKYGIPIKKWGKLKKFVITEQELTDLYLIKHLSAPKIARKKGCSPSLIYQHLKNYSIPRRHTEF